MFAHAVANSSVVLSKMTLIPPLSQHFPKAAVCSLVTVKLSPAIGSSKLLEKVLYICDGSRRFDFDFSLGFCGCARDRLYALGFVYAGDRWQFLDHLCRQRKVVYAVDSQRPRAFLIAGEHLPKRQDDFEISVPTWHNSSKFLLEQSQPRYKIGRASCRERV